MNNEVQRNGRDLFHGFIKATCKEFQSPYIIIRRRFQSTLCRLNW